MAYGRFLFPLLLGFISTLRVADPTFCSVPLDSWTLASRSNWRPLLLINSEPTRVIFHSPCTKANIWRVILRRVLVFKIVKDHAALKHFFWILCFCQGDLCVVNIMLCCLCYFMFLCFQVFTLFVCSQEWLFSIHDILASIMIYHNTFKHIVWFSTKVAASFEKGSTSLWYYSSSMSRLVSKTRTSARTCQLVVNSGEAESSNTYSKGSFSWRRWGFTEIE